MSAKPKIPDLVGAAEARDILGGISKQRLSRIIASKPFPEPVLRLRMGPLWLRSDVEAFAALPKDKGGRPRKPAAPDTKENPPSPSP